MMLPAGAEVQSFYLGMFFLLAGAVVGILALSQNKIENFNITPDIKDGCELVKSGIYTYVRHPMYASVLLGMFGIMILYANVYEFVLYLLLVVTLITKLHYEESLWKCASEEYVAYSKTTYKLIPYVF